jgi:hypothetical protein
MQGAWTRFDRCDRGSAATLWRLASLYLAVSTYLSTDHGICAGESRQERATRRPSAARDLQPNRCGSNPIGLGGAGGRYCLPRSWSDLWSLTCGWPTLALPGPRQSAASCRAISTGAACDTSFKQKTRSAVLPRPGFRVQRCRRKLRRRPATPSAHGPE